MPLNLSSVTGVGQQPDLLRLPALPLWLQSLLTAPAAAVPPPMMHLALVWHVAVGGRHSAQLLTLFPHPAQCLISSLCVSGGQLVLQSPSEVSLQDSAIQAFHKPVLQYLGSEGVCLPARDALFPESSGPGHISGLFLMIDGSGHDGMLFFR